MIVVPGDVAVQNLEEFLAGLEGRPGRHGDRRRLQGWHRPPAGRADRRRRGIDPQQLNYLAFSGGGEALNALLANTVDASISGYNEFADQIEAGNVRALAMGTKERVDGIDVPSLGEQGVDVELTNWRGLVAPPGLTDGAAAGAGRHRLRDDQGPPGRTPSPATAGRTPTWPATSSRHS